MDLVTDAHLTGICATVPAPSRGQGCVDCGGECEQSAGECQELLACGKREGRGGELVVFSPSLSELDVFCGLLVFVEYQDSVPIYVMGVNHEKYSTEYAVEPRAPRIAWLFSRRL